MTTHDHRSDVTGSQDQQSQARSRKPTNRSIRRAVGCRRVRRRQLPVSEQTKASAVAIWRNRRFRGAAPSLEAARHPQSLRARNANRSTAEMLFADDELADMRARWAGVQAAFVDDPKDCVQKADVLVSDLVEQLTTGFAHARSRLEEQWAQRPGSFHRRPPRGTDALPRILRAVTRGVTQPIRQCRSSLARYRQVSSMPAPANHRERS